ncbi:RNA polymerase sigma factor [Coprothermobacter platensis]|uniref:RNA polymerase sigma factor n=1 Tax=Coprothermobacter platensis TaxID=108819 RepID=UPI0003797281|nr:RNA polymerase sigma factor [Coprothermobacter platensis]
MNNEVERAFELYGKRLYAYMRRLGLSQVEAEDGVQEVFIRAMQSRIDWSSPKGYLFKIAHNWAMDTLKGRMTLVEEDDTQGYSDGGSFEDVHLLMQSLREDERSILLLLYQEGLSYSEVAELTGKPENTIKSIVHRAKEKIKKEV